MFTHTHTPIQTNIRMHMYRHRHGHKHTHTHPHTRMNTSTRTHTHAGTPACFGIDIHARARTYKDGHVNSLQCSCSFFWGVAWLRCTLPDSNAKGRSGVKRAATLAIGEACRCNRVITCSRLLSPSLLS